MSDEKLPITYKKNQIPQDTHYMNDDNNSEEDDFDENDDQDENYFQPSPVTYRIPFVPEAVQLFLSAIANRNEEEAIACLDKEEIQIFLKAHINSPINCKPNGGMAPIYESFLMFASEYGLPKLAEKLINIGADVNLIFEPMLLPMHEIGATALALASRNGHLSVAKMLIEKGANVDSGFYCYTYPESFFVTHGAQVGHSHTSPIFDCLLQNKLDVAKYLLSKGATFNLTDTEWEGHFQSAFSFNIPWQSTIGDKEKSSVLKFIDLYNFFADRQFASGVAQQKKEQILIQIFHRAIWKNQLPLVQMLVEKYSTLIDSFNTENYSHHDWSDEQKEFYALSSDSTGEFAVECAARAKNFTILKFLADKGAKLDTSNICYNGLYAHEKGIITGLNGVGVFKNSDCGVTELHYFASIGDENIDRIKSLLQKCNLHAKDKWGRTALDIALANKQCKTMQLLIKNGASIEPLIEWKEKHKSNLLHFLLKNDNDNISYFHTLGELIDKKIIDVNEKDSFGRTPLMIASHYSTLNAVQFLINHGAQTDVRENAGFNAFDIAIDDGTEESFHKDYKSTSFSTLSSLGITQFRAAPSDTATGSGGNNIATPTNSAPPSVAQQANVNALAENIQELKM